MRHNSTLLHRTINCAMVMLSRLYLTGCCQLQGHKTFRRVLYFTPKLLRCLRVLSAAGRSSSSFSMCTPCHAGCSIIYLSRWLQHQGGQVEKLQVAFTDGNAVLQMPSTPLPKLQQLELQAADVLPPVLAGSSNSNCAEVDNSSGRASALLPKLTDLTITSCSMQHPNHLAQITQAPGLTRLCISQLTFADGSLVFHRELHVREQVSAAVSNLLQQLPRLSSCTCLTWTLIQMPFST